MINFGDHYYNYKGRFNVNVFTVNKFGDDH